MRGILITIEGNWVLLGTSGNCSLRSPLPALTAPRQVIALLELPTMQLAGNKGPAMTVDTMREVNA